MSQNEFFKLAKLHFNIKAIEILKSELFIYTRYDSTFGQFIHLEAGPGKSFFNEFFFSENVLLPYYGDWSETFEFCKALNEQKIRYIKDSILSDLVLEPGN